MPDSHPPDTVNVLSLKMLRPETQAEADHHCLQMGLDSIYCVINMGCNRIMSVWES